MKYNVLLVDDDASIRLVLGKSLTKAGFNVQATDNPQTLMKWVGKGEGHVILTDVHMGTDDIFSFIPDIKKLRPELPIIIMSANTSVMTALKSASASVFDYIPKPFDLNDVEEAIERALGRQKPVRQSGGQIPVPMIGTSQVMQPVFRAISDYMSGDIPVYISGAVGTGKNHAAKLLHDAGKRSDQPFIEFSDHQVGDLSGITKGGDLFVDRVDELPKDRQALLLRLLEKNEIAARGEKFRLITIANMPAAELQDSQSIRPDLYYHLIGGEIALPALTNRADDIDALALHFLNPKGAQAQKKLDSGAIGQLHVHHWPGNVRELKTLMNRVSMKYPDMVITVDMLRPLMVREVRGTEMRQLEDIRAASRALLQGDKNTQQTPYVQAMSWVEKPLIEEALRLTNGNNLKAAELLGIHRNTLRVKIKTLKIGQ